MIKARLVFAIGLLTMWAAFPGQRASAQPDKTEELIKVIKDVGREGSGGVEACAAWKRLVEGGAGQLPAILAGFDDGDLRATNWLRLAVDAIAEKELKNQRSLPAAALEEFVKDSKHSGKGRKAAYEWLVVADPTAPDRLLPTMLDDPGQELRREAVARVQKEIEQLMDHKDAKKAKEELQKLLGKARDRDQVDEIAKQLEKMDVKVDLAAQFGFVRDWAIVSPFDNSNGSGFKTEFPPENKVDITENYPGKKDSKTSWVGYSSKDSYGVVDLNKVVGKLKGTTAYAFAVVESPEERPIEIRAGCINALKIFVNGKEVYSREEYHHGMEVDQHLSKAVLKKGRNEILVKVCQNEQTEPWAQEWRFQLRVCDYLGAAVPMKVEKSAAKEKEIIPESKEKK